MAKHRQAHYGKRQRIVLQLVAGVAVLVIGAFAVIVSRIFGPDPSVASPPPPQMDAPSAGPILTVAIDGITYGDCATELFPTHYSYPKTSPAGDIICRMLGVADHSDDYPVIRMDGALYACDSHLTVDQVVPQRIECVQAQAV